MCTSVVKYKYITTLGERQQIVKKPIIERKCRNVKKEKEKENNRRNID